MGDDPRRRRRGRRGRRSVGGVGSRRSRATCGSRRRSAGTARATRAWPRARRARSRRPPAPSRTRASPSRSGARPSRRCGRRRSTARGWRRCGPRRGSPPGDSSPAILNMLGSISSRPCDAVNVVASAPRVVAPCSVPAAPASDCISMTSGTVPHRFGRPARGPRVGELAHRRRRRDRIDRDHLGQRVGDPRRGLVAVDDVPSDACRR